MCHFRFRTQLKCSSYTAFRLVRVFQCHMATKAATFHILSTFRTPFVFWGYFFYLCIYFTIIAFGALKYIEWFHILVPYIRTNSFASSVMHFQFEINAMLLKTITPYQKVLQKSIFVTTSFNLMKPGIELSVCKTCP